MEALAQPGSTEWNLDAPGDCLVLKVPVPTKLVLHVSPQAHGSKDAVVKLEYLTSEPQAQKASYLPKAPAYAKLSDDRARQTLPPAGLPSKLPPLRLLAHVSRIGDVWVNEGEWIAGPERPLPIEGLQLNLDSPVPGFDIRYAAVGRQENLNEATLQSLGSFVGTRAQARPLTGLRLEISPSSGPIEIEAHAVFFGAPIQKARGTSIILTGPTKKEALLGLNVMILHDIAINNRQGFYDLAESGKAAAGHAQSRVLVFR